MATTTTSSTVTISSDIAFSVREVESNSNFNSYADSLNYILTFNHGTGIPGQSGVTNSQVNVYVKSTGTIAASGSATMDLTAYKKYTLGQEYTVSFTTVKGIVIENLATGIGQKLYVTATGSNAWTVPFNGGSGNIPINPYSTYQYLDPYGATVSASSKYLQIHNLSSTGIGFEVIVVGTNTGLASESIGIF